MEQEILIRMFGQLGLEKFELALQASRMSQELNELKASAAESPVADEPVEAPAAKVAAKK